MKDYTYLFDELDKFPTARQLYPFKMYSSHEEMWASLRRPPLKFDIKLDEFQTACLSPEWKAASIVHDKYRRKHDLTHQDLRELVVYITEWSKQRESDGKKVSKEILIQECSAELKRRINKI